MKTYKELMEDLTNKNFDKLFLDLDGVLTNFEYGAKKLLGTKKFNLGVGEDALNKLRDGGIKGFWNSLPLLPEGKKVYRFVEKYNPWILSSCSEIRKNCPREKKEWVNKNFPSIPTKQIIIVQKSTDKKNYAKNNILIDDFSRTIKEWNFSGGIGILHRNSTNTIKQLKEII